MEILIINSLKQRKGQYKQTKRSNAHAIAHLLRYGIVRLNMGSNHEFHWF